ncbi:uncharacterized protein RCC_03928 [Ramularia collo-cygni]|uniref:Uncharacterized protein n=1 Tax=Ramularia collo-cygni TaxID=112498 RepID=A0A2D3V9A2_9PEZI|nr:uncharacterized protein RCC_03928 [Ramularia collo-cygni]CZT18089.1 uncharacterized protein RCC_03928 [Ramularia collo-cygni]
MKYHEPGRPPGVVSSVDGIHRRRRTINHTSPPLLQEWELRDRYYNQHDDLDHEQYLVEEVESNEDDDEYTRRRGMYDEDYYSEDERHYSPPITSRERERDEALMQSAYARIARAREKGKTNVNLSQEEMQALERGRMGRRTSGPQQALERRTIQLPEPSPLATPPKTPAAAAAISSKTKDKVKATSSRSSSATSLASLKKSGRKSTGLISSSPAKSNSKAKVQRKGSISLPSELHAPIAMDLLQAPPGMRLVNGPNGIPVYAPIELYSGRNSPIATRSRSGSIQRKESMPEYPPSSMSTRYRPGSSSSLRDDGDAPYDYYGSPGRRASVSSAQRYRDMPSYGYEYGERPISRHQHHQQEFGESPLSVRYAGLRRAAPPSATPMTARDRDRMQRLPSGESSASSEGSEEQGVRVEVRVEEGGGYAVVEEDVSEGKKEKKDSREKDRDKRGVSGSVRKRRKEGSRR